MRTAVITGATKGIGKAIAMRLAADGYNLVLNYASDEKAAEIARQECLALHRNIAVVKGDVSVKEDVRHIVGMALDEFGSLDAVINNAALNIDKPLLDLSEEDWDQVVDINMKGVFLVCQEAARRMQGNENGGSIINIGSTTGIRGRKNGVNYCASKAGVIVMTKCLAMELGPAIRVNCLIPGFTWTGETEKRFNLRQNATEELQKRNIPLGRIGQPEEIADVAAFLLSPEAKYIHGQKIIVDGGQFMY